MSLKLTKLIKPLPKVKRHFTIKTIIAGSTIAMVGFNYPYMHAPTALLAVSLASAAIYLDHKSEEKSKPNQ